MVATACNNNSISPALIFSQPHQKQILFTKLSTSLNTANDTLTSKRPCGPNRRSIRAATYDLAKNDPWKEQFESLPEYAFEDVADWERKLIQERVRALRGT